MLLFFLCIFIVTVNKTLSVSSWIQILPLISILREIKDQKKNQNIHHWFVILFIYLFLYLLTETYFAPFR